MSMRIPIVVCGVTGWIGKGVIAGLKPEYEVIHFIFTPQAGAAEIPGLLMGQAPAASSKAFKNNIGSRNYSNPPVAIVLGSGYGDNDVKMMRDACGSSGNIVPWLRPDMSKRTPLLLWGYGGHLAARVKACLEELEREGKMREGGIVFY